MYMPFSTHRDTNSNTGYTASEQMNATLSIQTQAAKLVISKTTVKAWPGFKLFIDVGGWDQFSHFTTATAGFFFTPFNDSLVRSYVVFFTCTPKNKQSNL